MQNHINCGARLRSVNSKALVSIELNCSDIILFPFWSAGFHIVYHARKASIYDARRRRAAPDHKLIGTGQLLRASAPDTARIPCHFGMSHQRTRPSWFCANVGECRAPSLGSIPTWQPCPHLPFHQVAQMIRVVWTNAAAEAELSISETTAIRAGTPPSYRPDGRSASASGDPLGGDLDSGLYPSSAGVPIVLDGGDGALASVCWVVGESGLVLVWINNRSMTEERLAAASLVYGITPAQMRVPKLMIDGHDIVAAANRLGVSVNTARTHLQRMYDRTGVRSQPALVRALLSVSRPFGAFITARAIMAFPIFIGGIGNARWAGTPLAPILEEGRSSRQRHRGGVLGHRWRRDRTPRRHPRRQVQAELRSQHVARGCHEPRQHPLLRDERSAAAGAQRFPAQADRAGLVRHRQCQVAEAHRSARPALR